MEKKPQEERLFERLNLPIKVNYEIFNRPHDIKKVISKNISGGGICLSLTEKLVPETKLKMEIKLPKAASRQPEDYKLEGRVVWSRMVEILSSSSPSVYYDTGIQFQGLDPVVIGRIVNYFHGREL